MTDRENVMSIINRTGYDKMPVELYLCASLAEKFEAYKAAHPGEVDDEPSQVRVEDLAPAPISQSRFWAYYDVNFRPGTFLDEYGVAHEPGSDAAFHMTRMYHPMEKIDSLDEMKEYPFLDYTQSSPQRQKAQVEQAHRAQKAAMGNMQMTIWETAWYLRGMENLMMEMLEEDEKAVFLLDRITQNAVLRAESFARSGVDILGVGDDIGMQKGIMMSEQMYCDWLKPRMKAVIDAARAINPNIKVHYHSDGYIEPFIPHLIEIGVDVLNPVQPECMDFAKLHSLYGDVLSFNGAIGTQTTMPFGTAEEVREAVFRSLDIAGPNGGLLVCPTHLLEPEVPVENVVSYINACHDYTK